VLRFPYLLGRGRQLGDDHADFRYFDFPAHGPNTEALLCVWRVREDAVLMGEMMLVLKNLAGEEGVKAVRHFLTGNGKPLRHGPETPLSRMAARSPQFVANFLDVAMKIKEGVKRLAPRGLVPDFSALRVKPPPTHWGLKEFPLKSGFSEIDTLKAILGGTQGENLYARTLIHDPARRTYELGLRWVILDHFGVGSDDLYAPGLIPFFILQHERRGYRPYVNEVVIEGSVSGTY
jgi:hypothetical protein